MIDFLNQKTISISILDVDKLDVFLDKLNKFKEEQNLDNIVIHFDVMDNKFVPNTGIDLSEIKIVKKYGFFVDVHLMCTNPKSYIDKACFYGADNITIHYEIDNLYENLDYLNNLKVTLKLKNKDLSVGIAIKPDTDIEKIFNYSQACDMILLMSVEPGYGGQTYINKVSKKIEIATDMNKMVQIDGGINDKTIIRPNKLGIKSFVIGSYITKDIPSMNSKILKIEDIIKNERG